MQYMQLQETTLDVQTYSGSYKKHKWRDRVPKDNLIDFWMNQNIGFELAHQIA
jgi:hypothetical protein